MSVLYGRKGFRFRTFQSNALLRFHGLFGSRCCFKVCFPSVLRVNKGFISRKVIIWMRGLSAQDLSLASFFQHHSDAFGAGFRFWVLRVQDS